MKYQWRTFLFSPWLAVMWTLSVKFRLCFYIMCIYVGTKLNWGTNFFINNGWQITELLFLASQHHHQWMDWVLNNRKYWLCKQCEKHFVLLFAHGIWESSVEKCWRAAWHVWLLRLAVPGDREASFSHSGIA